MPYLATLVSGPECPRAGAGHGWGSPSTGVSCHYSGRLLTKTVGNAQGPDGTAHGHCDDLHDGEGVGLLVRASGPFVRFRGGSRSRTSGVETTRSGYEVRDLISEI